MKTRALRRLRRALKKRQTHHTKRVLNIADARRAAERFESEAVASTADRFTRLHEPALYPVAEAPKPTGGALLAAMLQGKKA